VFFERTGIDARQLRVVRYFKSLAKKQTHHRVKIRLMAMHHIQQGHTYANTAKTYLVNIIERYC
jgi:hypothetical protein